ncbi:phosphoribosylamine--glycine ligase [Helicobacter kayseriensis]|uniref:phosphoribosylamine--glycine ligase n=1 Tax=Helicobacter kayseriensis TaxID=2905877 RepID=UPI001E4EFD57|nr:phosphoribosylamine--glycine ligase [Helicobacter kayseriensis]MCE3048500.1 phosphoribosylamine--glycine ligase [Helicobacter kayseriensis]
MKVAIIGSGGREHMILKKIKHNPKITQLFVIPGNAGMQQEATCVPLDITRNEEVLGFALEQKLDFVIVSPDNPLVGGMVDVLEEAGIACFGPRQNGAILEGSKIFAKDFMKRHAIPTAQYWTFSSTQEAIEFLHQASFPIVIKADGLAFGKGVIIAQTLQEGVKCLKEMMEEEIFGESGKQVVIEEFLEGKEASILAFCDGKNIAPMISSMDYKKALDGDQGLNTGGMGCIAPNPYYTKEIAQKCMETIFLPTLKGLQSENRDFRGCLYFGLMLTKEGPKVIEYNCRFGDPETQTILPLLKSDLFEIMLKVSKRELRTEDVIFEEKASCCVVLASSGYPKDFEVGHPITYPSSFEICFAGVKEKDHHLINSGGRVLSVTSIASTLQEARQESYQKISQIDFKNRYYRTDIGKDIEEQQ